MGAVTERQVENYLIEQQADLYRLAYSYLHSKEDALDAVQTTACRVLEKWQSLRDPNALRTWVTRILVNVCTDLLRQRKRVVLASEEMLDTGSYHDPDPADSLEEQLGQLPTEIQTVIRLRFFRQFSLTEIAEVTGWNLSTVKTRLYTGLKKLRVSMEGGAV